MTRRAVVATGIVVAGWLIAAGRLLEWVVTNEIER